MLHVLGAVARAICVAGLILTPSLVLPFTGVEAREMATLAALVAAAVILFEYGSSHPVLIEFRFARPYNRLRFLALFIMVAGTASIMRAGIEPHPYGVILARAGHLPGQFLAPALNPLWSSLGVLNGDPVREMLLNAALGLCLLAAAGMLFITWSIIKIHNWPFGLKRFNLWVNLPSLARFDQAGIRQRMRRDAIVNLMLGLCLPILLPLFMLGLLRVTDILTGGAGQPLLWAIVGWVFLPASLIMRAMALWRLARVVEMEDAPDGATSAPLSQSLA